jgi:DNA-binding SARP family transcriptional activator
MLSRLCAEALQAGLEAESVRQAIRRYHLLPEGTPVDGWPWPVKVYSLGHFYLVRDGESRFTETRSQRKPLNLLEVVIAYGGKDVPIERIIEVLWPDAEGDAAVSAFTTTVSRLRKLVGSDTLSVRRGRISIDRRRCWTDVAALERRMDEADETPDPALLRRIGDQILGLYRGPFLADEDGDWPRALRNRLRARLCRFLIHCAASAEGQGCVSHLVERLQMIDTGLEPYCRNQVA